MAAGEVRTFGEGLRGARQAAGITLKEVARRLSDICENPVSHERVRQFEQGDIPTPVEAELHIR